MLGERENVVFVTVSKWEVLEDCWIHITVDNSGMAMRQDKSEGT